MNNSHKETQITSDGVIQRWGLSEKAEGWLPPKADASPEWYHNAIIRIPSKPDLVTTWK